MPVLEMVYNPLLALAELNDFREISKDSITSRRVNLSEGGNFLKDCTYLENLKPQVN